MRDTYLNGQVQNYVATIIESLHEWDAAMRDLAETIRTADKVGLQSIAQNKLDPLLETIILQPYPDPCQRLRTDVMRFLQLTSESLGQAIGNPTAFQATAREHQEARTAIIAEIERLGAKYGAVGASF